MTIHIDQAREAARDRESGRFGEQPKADPGTAAIATDWRTVTKTVTRDEADEDGLGTHTEEVVRGDAEFQRRCRRVLGLTDDTLPVTVVHSESESNPWGCDTWESSEEVTISCGGKHLTVDDLPELFRRLDAADLPRLDEAAALDLLASGNKVKLLLPDGDAVTGTVVNCNAGKVVISDGALSSIHFSDIIGYEEQP